MARRKPRTTSAPESIETAHVLFMDVVGYSKLANDTQANLIGRLTSLVERTAEYRRAADQEQVIPLPTGDGMALVFTRFPEAPARCALEVAGVLQNDSEIRLRMGIHTGPVYFRRAIGGAPNAWGDGVNFAARAMDRAGEGQILLTRDAAAPLLRITTWENHLRDLGEHEVKHGVKLHLYNLLRDGLGSNTPLSRTTEDPTRYLEILKEETGWIDIRGLHVGSGKAHRFRIQDLYVPLTTPAEAAMPDTKEGEPKEALRERPKPVSLEETLTHTHLVLVGDPG